jgi:VWFA-related protein
MPASRMIDRERRDLAAANRALTPPVRRLASALSLRAPGTTGRVGNVHISERLAAKKDKVAEIMSVFKSFVLAATMAAAAGGSNAAAREAIAIHPADEQAMYASVLDKQGVPVTTLGSSDFVVRERGVEREVIQAAPASEPMRIAVLVDTSQSMERSINDIRRALHTFFAQIQGNADIALFEFGERPMQLVDYTRDPARLEAGIGRLFARPASGAYTLDAIVDAARDVRMRETARPVIVVISGQGPEFSQRYHQSVLDDLRSSHATLHSLVITRRRVPIFNDGIRERELTLSEGAKLTGGRREDLLTSMALADRLSDLARELKSQYRVVYARPETMIPADRIEVSVRKPRLTVRASQVPPAFRARR